MVTANCRRGDSPADTVLQVHRCEGIRLHLHHIGRGTLGPNRVRRRRVNRIDPDPGSAHRSSWCNPGAGHNLRRYLRPSYEVGHQDTGSRRSRRTFRARAGGVSLQLGDTVPPPEPDSGGWAHVVPSLLRAAGAFGFYLWMPMNTWTPSPGFGEVSIAGPPRNHDPRHLDTHPKRASDRWRVGGGPVSTTTNGEPPSFCLCIGRNQRPRWLVNTISPNIPGE